MNNGQNNTIYEHNIYIYIYIYIYIISIYIFNKLNIPFLIVPFN